MDFYGDIEYLIHAAAKKANSSEAAHHICVLPAVTLIKLTRVVSVVQADVKLDTSVSAIAKDECPPNSLNVGSAEYEASKTDVDKKKKEAAEKKGPQQQQDAQQQDAQQPQPQQAQP